MEQLTIIVPVYNVEKYLEECLESIRNQTFTDFKVLMFNDGSTDNSPDILKRYQDLDKRFIFIDKKNEGYGATCNRGLDMAETEWVAIVEPDDFIAADMYEGLLSAERDEAERKPDIVKGSYWEYYEPAEGYNDALRAPNLAKSAPKRRKVSTIEGNIQLLIHHPSIWSSIYRKSFLTKNNLRFVEAKGAGWVDNPFYFAALNLAENILWVPKQYYYYRMTNAEASRYLKDFHLPFDRLREMWAFSKQHHISRQATGVLYARSLDYIDQVVNRYGFDESDPELLKLIKEVIEPMDETIVFSDPAVLPKFRTYYMDFTGTGDTNIDRHAAEQTPLLSYIVPLRNQRNNIIPFLSSLISDTDFPAELIVVNCNSHDRSGQVIEKLASQDHRIKLISISSNSLSEGMRSGQADAIGEYITFLDANTTTHVNQLRSVLSMADKYHSALIDCGMRSEFVEELIQRSQNSPSIKLINQSRPVFQVSATDVEDFFLALRPNVLGNTIYRRDFLVENRLSAGRFDGSCEAELRYRSFKALREQDGQILLMTRTIRGEQTEIPVTLPFYRQKLYSMDDHSPDPTLTSVLTIYNEILEKDPYSKELNSAKRVAVESFSRDIHSRLTTDSLEEYINAYQDRLQEALQESNARELGSAGPFNEFERLRRNNEAFFYRYLYIQTLDLLKKERDKNRKLLLSTRYRIGEKVTNLGKTLAPKKLLTKVYRGITQKLR